MNMQEKPQVGKSILFSVIGLIAFYLCYFVVIFAFAALFTLLMKIPVISSIIEFVFRTRGDTPDILMWLLGAVLAWNAVVWMLHRFHDSQASENLSLKITGIALLALNVLFLIVNLIGHSPIFPNIVVGIAGLVMFLRGKA